MKFNAGVFLSDEEVRHPTEAGRESYPMKWVHTHKKTYLRRDNDNVSTRYAVSILFSLCAIRVVTSSARTTVWF